MITFLDCTLRDGGYYNSWDFSMDLVEEYLEVMQASGVDVVELGFRTLKNEGFQGPHAFTTDDYILSLKIPQELTIGVMVNGSELVGAIPQYDALQRLFPLSAKESPVDLVRIACHVHEFEKALPAVKWLKKRGYQVGFNLMQVSDRTEDEIKLLALQAKTHSMDALYFADSMGALNSEQTTQIIRWFRAEWDGPLGIHTHDNIGLALSNTLRALDDGVTWVDSTVTGMGRGPGNARTEELAIDIAHRRGVTANMVPLMQLLRKHFKPMQAQYGWGTNPYYYLSGKYGIHPTYVQEMINDSRYDEEDIIAVLEHLRTAGGKRFSFDALNSARHFYSGNARGFWRPSEIMEGREVIILGTGPGVSTHQSALEAYIRENKPIVIALNTLMGVSPELINFSIACHPIRLLADATKHVELPHPLITPAAMLPESLRIRLGDKSLLDFGLGVSPKCFEFHETYCITPTSMVIAYALAVAISGHVKQILLAGFDGYAPGDKRNDEMNDLLHTFFKNKSSVDLLSVTPTVYDIHQKSIYGLY